MNRRVQVHALQGRQTLRFQALEEGFDLVADLVGGRGFAEGLKQGGKERENDLKNGLCLTGSGSFRRAILPCFGTTYEINGS